MKISPAISRSALSLLFLLLLLTISPAKSDGHDPPPLIRLPTDSDLCPGAADPATCPVKCFRTDPVCGADGVTYWCGCPDALCAGARVAKLGFCDVGNGGSGSLSGQAFLLIHIVWLVLLGFSILFGLL